MSTDETTEITLTFNDLGLSDTLLRAITDTGYTVPSPIQAQTIPHVLAGTDVLGQAQTGTGKTAAFALPTLQKIKVSGAYTQVLVLTPTRELAIQVSEAYKTYGKHCPEINVVPIYGGAEYRTQIRALSRGAHVVVGTPGRVMDHIRRGILSLSKLNTLVLDEADEMLRMGFIDDVEWVLEQSPENKQITLFSATMPQQIKKISQRYLKDEVEIKIKSVTETASTIHQRFVAVPAKQKQMALTRILEMEEFDAAIIFVRTKSATEELAESLTHSGFSATAINGDLQQKQRERVIDQLKRGKIDILIATDVAARGLDVERISHVINYDLPQDSESYVHRIGRTGRAGRKGDAILFVSPRDKRALATLERFTKNKIVPYELPSVDQVNAKRIDYFKSRIAKIIEKRDLSAYEQIITDFHNETDTELLTVAAALAQLAEGRKPLLLSEKDNINFGQFAPDNASRAQSRDRGNAGRQHPKRDRSKGPVADQDSVLYRIAVGRQDQVKPGHIVGAITNEAGIEGRQIGQIEIYPDHSVVSLPKNMADSVFQRLKKVTVLGKKMDISEYKAGGAGQSKSSDGKKPAYTKSKDSQKSNYQKMDKAPKKRHQKTDKAPVGNEARPVKRVRKRKDS